MDAARQEGRLGKAYTAPSITVFYDQARCRHDAEYVRGLPQVFDVTWRLWVRADLADAEAVAEVVRRCPTGALHYRLVAGDPEAPTRPTTTTRDPVGRCWSAATSSWTPDGALPETRAALCGCDRTENPPFCDGGCGVNDHRPAGTQEPGAGILPDQLTSIIADGAEQGAFARREASATCSPSHARHSPPTNSAGRAAP